MKNFKGGKTWGVLGKQKTYYPPTHFMGAKVPLNANPLDAWDTKRSRYRRVDGLANDQQQSGVPEPQVPDVSPTPTPTGTAAVTPTPTTTLTSTPTPTGTPTPTPSPQTVRWVASNSQGIEGYSISPSGTTWTRTTEPTDFTFFNFGIAYNGSRWGGAGDYLLSAGTYVRISYYSDNGYTWTTGSTFPTPLIYGTVSELATNGSIWVVGGSSFYPEIITSGFTTVGYSYDAITYSAGTITPAGSRPQPSNVTSFAFDGNMWIGATTSTGTTTGGTRAIYSYNGINWSGLTSPLFSGNSTSVTYGNGKWVMSQSLSNNNAKILASTDGFNWTASTNANAFGIFSGTAVPSTIVYFKGLFVAASSSLSGASYTLICYSTDGLTWSAATDTKTLINRGIQHIASNGDVLIAASTTGATGNTLTTYISNNGINWSANTGNINTVFTGTSSLNTIASNVQIQPPPNPTPSPTPTTTLTSTPTNTPTPSITPSPSVPASGTTEANTYLEAVVQAGGTGVTSTVSAATRTLFTSLVSNNLWDKVITMYPMVGGTAASHAVMGKTTGVKTITWNGGVTHGVSGATGNGVNGYGDTNFNLVSTSGYAQNDLSYGIYVTVDGGGANVYDFGVHGNTALDDRPYDLAARRSGTGQALFDAGGTAYNTRITYTTSTGRGFLFGVRRASNDRELYKNGTSVGTSSVNDDTNITSLSSPFILAQNPGGGGTVYYSDNTIGFVITGKAFSDSEASTLSTIINTFMTSLGRNAY